MRICLKVPIVTHEGSGLGGIPNQIKNICVGANVVDALAVRGASVKSARNVVDKWI